MPFSLCVRLILHDCYSDALGWSSDKSTTDAGCSVLCSCSLQTFLKRLGSVEGNKCAVIIDSLSLLLFHHPPSVVCRLLQGIGEHTHLCSCTHTNT